MTTNPDAPLTAEELEQLTYACADAEILWRKRRQHAQGQINLGDVYEYNEDDCTQKMNAYRQLHERLTWLTAEDDDDL